MNALFVGLVLEDTLSTTVGVHTKKDRIVPHSSITLQRVMALIEERMTTLSNPGLCINCGEEALECEPDARKYDCDMCDSHATVFAPEELLEDIVW